MLVDSQFDPSWRCKLNREFPYTVVYYVCSNYGVDCYCYCYGDCGTWIVQYMDHCVKMASTEEVNADIKRYISDQRVSNEMGRYFY